jgi:hypothetical protein
MNPNHETLLARLPAHSKTAAVRAAAQAALLAADRYAERRNEMKASGQYTEPGVNAALRDLLPATIRSLQTARAPITALKREVAAKRDSLRRADPDKTDLAGALERGEIRQLFRTLPPTERQGLAMSTNDIRLLEALVTAPPELSGFTGNQSELIDQVEARYIALKHPAETAELEALEELVAEAEALVAVARVGIRDTANMEPRLFEAEAKKIEAAVWLVGKPGEEQVCEPDANGQAIYRPATAVDIATGVRYASAAEYHAARPA